MNGSTARIVVAIAPVVAAVQMPVRRLRGSVPAMTVLEGSLFGFGMWRFRTQFE